MSVYEALSVMIQFGIWIVALMTLFITLLIYMTKKK
ncbi:putative holin-like toxin [Paenibacillus montaniterrae]|nr:putative holin-like toxin [Paenibacillus montaniterrae]